MRITQEVKAMITLTKGLRVYLKEVMDDFLIIQTPGIREDIVIMRTT